MNDNVEPDTSTRICVTLAFLALAGCAETPPAAAAPQRGAPASTSNAALLIVPGTSQTTTEPTGCGWTPEAPGVDDCARVPKELSPLSSLVHETKALEQLLAQTPATVPDHAFVLAHTAAAHLELACAARRECEAGASTQGDAARGAHASHLRTCQRVAREHSDMLQRGGCRSAGSR